MKRIWSGNPCPSESEEDGADIALFPEMWSNGYNIYGRPAEEWKAEAVPSGGSFVRSFQRLAGELEMAIGVTLLEEEWRPAQYACSF